MKKIILFAIIAFIVNIDFTQANNNDQTIRTESIKDSNKTSELNAFWKELSRTVREGDFEGYKATYHEDAVVIFAVGKNKTSHTIASALAGWKQGFTDTKSGKVKSDVTFRFSQSISGDASAHETGIFHYKSIDSDGKELANMLVHFEMLLVNKNGKWLGVMEYQKSIATQDEWEALK